MCVYVCTSFIMIAPIGLFERACVSDESACASLNSSFLFLSHGGLFSTLYPLPLAKFFFSCRFFICCYFRNVCLTSLISQNPSLSIINNINMPNMAVRIRSSACKMPHSVSIPNRCSSYPLVLLTTFRHSDTMQLITPYDVIQTG